MNLRKITKIFFLFFLLFFLARKGVLAEDKGFVNIVIPVRGGEFWVDKPQSPLATTRLLKEWVDKNNLLATWLLRTDVFNSEEIIVFFKNFSEDNELGVFLEIMPQLAKEAEVAYPSGGTFWHDANKIFLSGYKPEDRIRLIDESFRLFKENFGYFPRTVGAWHVDAYSVEYMRRKYGVTGVLICADQFGTDGYQIWGGWWGVPYYPSRYNILLPAQTLANRLDLVVFWWAARDPEFGYGGSVEESTYSVQVNDYQRHNLGIEYFKRLLDVYLNNTNNRFNQITIGLENDNDWQKIDEGFNLQLQEIDRRVKAGEVTVLTMVEFSNWYKTHFRKLSPDHQIDEWYMSPSYRIGLIEKGGEKFLRDSRIYNERWPEANLLTANPWGTLSLNNPYKIDTVRFENSAVKTDFEIETTNLIKKFGSQKIPFEFTRNLFGFYCFVVSLLLVVFLRKNLPLLILVFFGSVSLSLTMVKSGSIYPFGMGFWGPNGHDGIWHIALINQLARFSLNHPTFAGEKLTNYHFGFDLLIAILTRMTGLNLVNLYFQIFSPLMAISLGVLVYQFIKKWLGSDISARWGTFFMYFGGSWGWLISLLRTGKLGGESMFWSNQSISTLINPPFAFSLIVLLAGLIRFIDFEREPNFKNLFLCSLFFGVLIQIKVYAGILILGSLFSLALFSSILPSIGVNIHTQRKGWWKLLGSSLLISLAIFAPFNLKASSLLVFSPLWFPHTMLAFSDRLGWFRLENARQAYFATGSWLRWILAEILAVGIFVLGNLGTRVIGFFYGGLLGKTKKKVTEIEIFLFSGLIISLIIPLLFIQKGNPWNTIQFFYYFQFFMAIFAGVFIGKLWENRHKSRMYHIFIYVTSVILMIMTIPTTVSTLKNDYLPSRPPARVSIEELEALEFLKKLPPGIVLTYPHDFSWHTKFTEPKPLYAYETTAYVSALGRQKTFLEDEMNLEISGYDWQPRRAEETRFFVTNDSEWADKFLKINKIKYIYLVKGQKMNLGLGDIDAKKIFENGETVIYQVN